AEDGIRDFHVTGVQTCALPISKNYIDNLSEETRKGMEEKARQGIWPSRAPYGYINITCGSRRSIEVDRALSDRIAHLFEVYAERSEERRVGNASRAGRRERRRK